jgi:hypothetical protein
MWHNLYMKLQITEDTDIKFSKYFGYSRVTACMGFFCFKIDAQDIFFYNPSPPEDGGNKWSVDFKDTEFYLGIPRDDEDIDSYYRTKKSREPVIIPRIIQPAIQIMVAEEMEKEFGNQHCGGCR